MVKTMTIATIDIGGTGIKFASLTPDGKILDKTSIPTPEAQCLREFEVEFALECHQAQERFSAYRRAKALQTPFTSLQLARQEGSVAATGSLLSHSVLSIPQICPTAFKVAENEEGYVLRSYNMCSENVRVPESQHLFLDLLERPYPVHRGLISPQEIRTEFIKKEEI